MYITLFYALAGCHPLKSASARSDAQAWNWDSPKAVPEPSFEREEIDFMDSRYHGEDPVHKQEPAPALEKSFGSHLDMPVENFDLDLPETIMDSDHGPILTTIEENCSNITFPSSPICHSEKPESTVESVSPTTVVNEISHVDLLDTSTLKIESVDPVEKTVGIEGDSQIEKDDEEGDAWEPEEVSKEISGSSPSLTSEGPGSFRSLSGKSDEGGNGTGSLSRLAGLGRAARRQLAAVLDEFWGQLYDFHGQATPEAKAKKLDLLLGLDSKPAISSMKVDSNREGIYWAERQCKAVWILLIGGFKGGLLHFGPTTFKCWMHMCKIPAAMFLMLGERRYSSLRLPPSSDGLDYQPATVHGYQIASYLSRIAKDKSSDYMNPPIESTPPKSPSLGPANYRDPLSFALGQKLQNGLGSAQASGPAETGGIPANTKKYHSLPDISGISVPLRNLYLSDRSAQWDNTVVQVQTLDPSGLDSLLSSLVVADKTRSVVGEGVGSRPNSITRDASSRLDLEAKLLQSFRHCIVRLIKLEGSDWLFRPNEGADEDLIYRVAAREKFLYEAETRDISWGVNMGEAQYSSSDRKSGFCTTACFLGSSLWRGLCMESGFGNKLWGVVHSSNS
ncbi:Protein ethylene-insensitive 2 [Vitis vinifera]|uniref:Protein ethylene-insensitive 2 n=1 Tax=Vitis vinifera TaxID=29760 RepID=A0A438D3X9_VITVI|nr:Protein ethylene-insensitive 2 [Vitis vinifera]